MVMCVWELVQILVIVAVMLRVSHLATALFDVLLVVFST